MKMKRLAAESTETTEQQLSLPKLSLFLILRNVSVLFLSLIPYNHENPDMFHTTIIEGKILCMENCWICKLKK